MNREALRWEGIRVVQDGSRILDGFRLRLYAGEVHGLVTMSEREALAITQLFAGTHVPSQGEQFIREERREFLRGNHPGDRKVHVVHRGAPLLPNLSVADNVVLLHSPHHMTSLIDERRLRRSAIEALDRFGYAHLVDRSTGELRLWERILVQASRAIAAGALGIVFENTFVDLPDEERGLFWGLLSQLAAQDLAVVVLGFDGGELRDRVSHLSYVRDGRSSSFALSDWSRKPSPERIGGATGAGGIRFRDLRTAHWHCPDLQAPPGLVTALVDVEGQATGEVSRLLRGAINYEGTVELDGRPLNLSRPGAGVRAGLFLIPEDPLELVVANLTVVEFLGLASRRRLSGPLGLRRKRVERYLIAEWAERLSMTGSEMDGLMGDFDAAAQRLVALQSLVLARPRAAVFLQPGSHLDGPTAAEVHRTMVELAHQGTAVLKIVHQF